MKFNVIISFENGTTLMVSVKASFFTEESTWVSLQAVHLHWDIETAAVSRPVKEINSTANL